MAIVNKTTIQGNLTRREIIRFQIISYFELKGVYISNAEIDMLIVLAYQKRAYLKQFCTIIAQKKVFKTVQSVYNSIRRLEKLGFIVKEGKTGEVIITLCSDMDIKAKGNVMIVYKFICFEPAKTEGNSQKSGAEA